MFAHLGHLESAAPPIFKRLAKEKNLNGSANARRNLGELNALHPFREGNGRAHANSIAMWRR